jgi:hypothetical protein
MFACHVNNFEKVHNSTSPASFFALFSRSPFCSFSPVLHSYALFRSVYYLPTLITFSCPPPSFPFIYRNWCTELGELL